MNWLIVQGDTVDSMLQWVLSQRGLESIKDPDLAKQVTLAVLRHAIPSPKVHLPTASCSISAAWVVIKADMLSNRILGIQTNHAAHRIIKPATQNHQAHALHRLKTNL